MLAGLPGQSHATTTTSRATTTSLAADEGTILHNPAMGWTLYPWESSRDWQGWYERKDQPPADTLDYWSKSADYYRNCAGCFDKVQAALSAGYPSIFYIRSSWYELQPTSPTSKSPYKYAWEDPTSRFYKAVKGARERHLPLAFLVYVTGWGDQGTPDWVFSEPSPVTGQPAVIDHCSAFGQAPWLPAYKGGTPVTGVSSCERPSDETWTTPSGKDWGPKFNGKFNENPNYQDPTFRAYFADFVKAFAAAFNNPADVAYVDGIGMGVEGENNHLDLQYAQYAPGNPLKLKDPTDPEVKTDLFNWVTGLYTTGFSRVLLTVGAATPGGREQFAVSDFKGVLEARAYMNRMNHAGDTTYSQPSEVQRWNEQWPSPPGVHQSGVIEQVMVPEKGQKGEGDPTGWKTYFSTVLQDAAALHANALDLRYPYQTAKWMDNGKDLYGVGDGLQWFAVHGGYRLAPASVTIPLAIRCTSARIASTWRNTGIGFLPNDMAQWNGKYRVAYALLDSSNKPVKGTVTVDTTADPGAWVDSHDQNLTSKVNLPCGLATSRYKLAAAIVDTTGQNRPAIQLALRAPAHDPATGAAPATYTAGWYEVGNITVI
jgi:hypothetical protein